MQLGFGARSGRSSACFKDSFFFDANKKDIQFTSVAASCRTLGTSPSRERMRTSSITSCGLALSGRSVVKIIGTAQQTAGFSFLLLFFSVATLAAYYAQFLIRGYVPGAFNSRLDLLILTENLKLRKWQSRIHRTPYRYIRSNCEHVYVIGISRVLSPDGTWPDRCPDFPGVFHDICGFSADLSRNTLLV